MSSMYPKLARQFSVEFSALDSSSSATCFLRGWSRPAAIEPSAGTTARSGAVAGPYARTSASA
jgi:hypothetical protein